MKKGYLYLVFIALSGTVALAIALAFRLISPHIIKEQETLPTLENQDKDLRLLVEVENYKDSWIYKIAKTKSQKTYIYPVEKFYIEFK